MYRSAYRSAPPNCRARSPATPRVNRVEVSSLYAHPSLVSHSQCSTSRRCISFCAELRNCALSKSLTFSPGLAKPRTPYIGLSIVFRFCAAACAQRGAQFAQLVVRSSEGIAQVLIGANGRPRRDGSFGSGGRSFHLPWQERSITPLAFCRLRRGVCGQWRYRV